MDAFSRLLASAMLPSFPKQDCCCLPLVHSSAEELARYLVRFRWAHDEQVGQLIDHIGKQVLKVSEREGATMQERGIFEMTIGVSEIEGQEARYAFGSE